MNQNFKGSFLFNLLIVLGLCSVLYICFFASLHWFTKHGQEQTIPNLHGKDMATAVSMLKNLHFEVNVDSTYEPAEKPLMVLKQVPDTGSIVKQGRTVFLTVNMLTPPTIPMPNLVNLSLRSAEMLLRNNKLLLGDTIYKPDIASGAVLEQRFNKQAIKPGEMILQGSKISLVIGNGLGNQDYDVPDVTGMTIDEAGTILNQYNQQLLITVADQLSQISDTSLATIVDQRPRALNDKGEPNRIKNGDIIDLSILQHPTPDQIFGSGNTNK